MDKEAARFRRFLRCAIYTRKSSEEGLEQEFNSLQAQREACEAFIRSQRHEGWSCLPQNYDDGGGRVVISIAPHCSISWPKFAAAKSMSWWCTKSTD